MMPDFAYHRAEIQKLREELRLRIKDWEFARVNDKVALPMARENLSGARESLRDAISEARSDFEKWVVEGEA